MTAKATISQADLRRMAAVAKSENVSVEIDIGGRKIRVIPNIPDIDKPNQIAKDEIVRL